MVPFGPIWTNLGRFGTKKDKGGTPASGATATTSASNSAISPCMYHLRRYPHSWRDTLPGVIPMGGDTTGSCNSISRGNTIHG